jgi:DNA-binding transcriptional regulator YiaG
VLRCASVIRHAYFDTATWPKDRPVTFAWTQIPSDYSDQIRATRQRLGLTLGEFAARVGAARKAVVYQWESRKRCPSPLFWQRIQALSAVDAGQ